MSQRTLYKLEYYVIDFAPVNCFNSVYIRVVFYSTFVQGSRFLFCSHGHNTLWVQNPKNIALKTVK